MSNSFSNLFSETTSFAVAGDATPLAASVCENSRYYRSFSLSLAREPDGDHQTGGFLRGKRARAKSFCVPKPGIAREGYDLSINRYKEVVHEEVDHRPPQAILDELESIEKEITQGMKQLRGMLK